MPAIRGAFNNLLKKDEFKTVRAVTDLNQTTSKLLPKKDEFAGNDDFAAEVDVAGGVGAGMAFEWIHE